MQIVSFMNMKGGVGKTTLTVNVAHALASLHGKRVLLVDGDPQFNATQYLLSADDYLEHIQDPKKGTLEDIFMPRRQGAVNTASGSSKGVNKSKMGLAECTIEIFEGAHGRGGRLDLLPSTLSLVEVQNSPRQTEARLKAYLKEKASNYDYVLIDCPPTISIFTLAAMLASDKYLVPIRPDSLSVIGLPLLERYMEDFVHDAGQKIEQVGMVFTMVRGPTPQAMLNVMADLRRQRKGAVFRDYLSEATSIAESVDAHEPILQFRKTPQKIKLQMVGIAQEFIKRTGA
jgi:chromosome partitioning protein